MVNFMGDFHSIGICKFEYPYGGKIINKSHQRRYRALIFLSFAERKIEENETSFYT